MARLMPQVLDTLTAGTGARFELMVLENDLFGPSVTTAALLPGRAFRRALEGRDDLDLALLPADAVNDDGLFLDDVPFAQLARGVPTTLRLSHDFADVLTEAFQA